jgi:hypothetical protein
VAALGSLPRRAAPPRRRRTAGRRLPAAGAGIVDAAAYLTASLGAPRWVERLQEIEGYRLEAESRLRARWSELARELRGRPEAFADSWREAAEGWSFAAHNDLVAQHNEYYPVERRLRYDLRRRDYVDLWGSNWRRQPLDAAWVLEALPPDLPTALADEPAAAATR